MEANIKNAEEQISYIVGTYDGNKEEQAAKAVSFYTDAKQYARRSKKLQAQINTFREESQQFVDSHKNPDTNSIMFGNVQGKREC